MAAHECVKDFATSACACGVTDEADALVRDLYARLLARDPAVMTWPEDRAVT